MMRWVIVFMFSFSVIAGPYNSRKIQIEGGIKPAYKPAHGVYFVASGTEPFWGMEIIGESDKAEDHWRCYCDALRTFGRDHGYKYKGIPITNGVCENDHSDCGIRMYKCHVWQNIAL
ncbi:MAG TPA: hypothetical protein VN040_05810 [Pseudosphingobacterium sp.]|nr:hypothetical protein [Pseudosphingobacterium sp.]